MSAPPPTSARLPLLLGFSAIALLVGVVGAWSIGTQIAGAVLAQGTVKVESERQVVQHPDGGVVGEIVAREGDRVAAGDMLLRLDGTFLRSELVIVERQLAEIFARGARLRAERDDADGPDFGAAPAYASIDAAMVAEQMEGQRSLFGARRESLLQERRQLAEQQAQIERQIEGVEAQLEGVRKQQELIARELRDLQSLLDRGLVQASRVLQLQREDARLLGEIGRLVATVAEAEVRITSLGIESLRLGDRRREDAIAELQDLSYQQIELEESRISLLERLDRLDVRAPVAGTVFGSHVFAVRSVVRAAEPLMYIVPGDHPLEVAARIDPIDIDQVYPGQDVSLVFTTFSSRTTPAVPGVVARVSADAQTDEKTGIAYYEAVVLPDGAALAALGEVTLLPGMPVETFLKTETRTPLSYLIRPLTIYFDRALREE